MRTLPFGSRTLVILDASEGEAIADLPSPFAMLVSADTDLWRSNQQRANDTALISGCIEFCCVGAHAEKVHDRIDSVLEERGMITVVTTWHSDEPLADSLHYFVHVAGNRPPTLVAMVDQDRDLLEALESAVAETKT